MVFSPPTFITALCTVAKVEETQVSIDTWMNKQNVGHTYNGVLFSLKKEGNSNTCYNMDKPWGHYAKWNKPVTKRKILHDSTYVRYLKQSNSER